MPAVYLLEDKVNRTTGVDVYKVDGGLCVEELSTSCHGVSVGATHLYTKDILTFVSFEQGPLTLLTLEGGREGGREGGENGWNEGRPFLK